MGIQGTIGSSAGTISSGGLLRSLRDAVSLRVEEAALLAVVSLCVEEVVLHLAAGLRAVLTMDLPAVRSLRRIIGSSL